MLQALAALVPAATLWFFARRPIAARPLASEIAGAAACGAALLASCAIGSAREPAAAAVLRPLAIGIAAGVATGLAEAPFWRRAWVARMIRIPVIEFVVLSRLGEGRDGAGASDLDPALAAALAVGLFLWWMALKEIAARRPGVLLLALAATAGATAALLARSGAAAMAGPSFALAILLALGVPLTGRAPRAVAGRGPLAPALVALAATWLVALPPGAGGLPRIALLLLAAAPLAAGLACVPRPGRAARIAAAAALLLSGACLAAAILSSSRTGAW